MDDNRFDAAARALGGGLSRRAAIRAVGVALGLGIATRSGMVSAKTAEEKAAKQAEKDAKAAEKQAEKEAKAAEKQAEKDAKAAEKQAEKDAKAAAKLCAGEAEGANCGVDGVCCGGSCKTAASFASDPLNCGTCGNACAMNIPCENGVCQYGSAGPGLCSDPTFTCDQPCSTAINNEEGPGCFCYSQCSGACYPCDVATDTCTEVPVVTCGPCEEAITDYDAGTCVCATLCDTCSACDGNGACVSTCIPPSQECNGAGTCITV